MSEVLLVEIDFNDQTWYLSEEGFIGDNYYAPYLESSPELELGQIKGGYISVRIGNISIANRANDRSSPFSIFGGGYSKLISNPTTKIPIRIYWEQNQQSESIFTGTMYLQSFDVDKLDFIIEDDFEDVDLLDSVEDIKSDLTEISTISIKGLGVVSGDNLAEVLAPDHGLSTGDRINVINSSIANFNTPEGSTLGDRRSITKVDDNFFRYKLDTATTSTQPSGVYSLKRLQKKNVPFSFGRVTREKGLIQTEDGTEGTRGFAYANPQLKIASDFSGTLVPIQLFDDGVLVGSNDTNQVKRTLPSGGVNLTGISVSYDVITITTSADHGLIAGDVIQLTGATPAVINNNDIMTGYVVIDAPSTTTFNIFNNAEFSDTPSVSSATITHQGEYFGSGRLPTAETIFSRSTDNTTSTTDGTVLLGTALVSGESKNGSTIADFFAFIANKLNIPSVDFSQAPNASSVNLQLWETRQTKVLDFAGELAISANYLFEIRNDIIKVIDRGFEPTEFISIANYDIISVSYKMPNPIKAIRSSWNVNVVNATQIPAQLDEREESVMITNLQSGEIRDITYSTKDIEEQRSILNSIKEVLNKPVITVDIGGIRSDIKVGNRIKFNREEDGVTVDMNVKTINFRFDNLQTQVAGDGIIKLIEQDDVY
tara:strand:+ start:10135 stop:12102 length:1968 start_codon:yes stop_codon:yes gene_type:complete